ncbi:MAG: S41 family peptidase [Cellvibrionaceae bacterium]
MLLSVLLCLTLGFAGCGSDSDSGRLPTDRWQAGVFQPADNFVNQCQAPRSGTDPSTGGPFPDQQGTGLDERNFLRSWSNETYLWYDEIIDRNPANYETPEYFDLLKTDATTPSGNPKDQFHFSIPTDQWQSQSQSGVSVGYGATWVLLKATPPRELIVAYVEPGSPAASGDANLRRGDRVVAIDGVRLEDGDDVGTLNAGLSPSQQGETHEFTVRDVDGNLRPSFSMSADNITQSPVLEVATLSSGEVGYILFNDHIATAEAQLIDAITQLHDAGIEDLVLDVRYNGGGFLAIASQLAYMIAGPTNIAGREFETLTFNDKRTDENVVIPFVNETVGLSVPEFQPLPTLGLSRVFVLTGPGTCSASESIMNGLRGVDVEVIQIGSTTCGKPYGFYPQDNCGTTYFTVQFRGENAKGFGDYPDGFSPEDQVSNAGVPIPGCSIGDDFTNELGDPDEARLAAALQYRNSSSCSLTPSSFGQFTFSASLASPSTLSAIDGRVLKSRGLQGRLMHQ